MTIHLPSTLSPDMLERIVNYLRRQKVTFHIENDAAPLVSEELEVSNWDADFELIIQKRLTEKYVASGEWATMNDDERQDASLLEAMLWQQEQPNFENQLYSETDTKDYITQLKKNLYAVSGH